MFYAKITIKPEKTMPKLTFKEWMERPKQRWNKEYGDFLYEYLSEYILTDEDKVQIYEVYKNWPKDDQDTLFEWVVSWFNSDEYQNQE